MKVVDGRSTGMPMGHLQTGEVFQYQGKYYMKTEVISDIGTESNCVNLETGEYGPYIAESKIVEQLCCELILK